MTAVFCSGATGYIGGAILRRLAREGLVPMGGVRAQTTLPEGITPIATGDLSEAGFKLPHCEVVIHAAGLGHKRGVGSETWQRQNVVAAVNLAKAARVAGAARFVLISTAYVHGRVHAGVVTDTTPPNPMDEYAQSKLQAEHDVAAAFGPGLSIVRPAAVIGPGCPGNIPFLLKLLRRRVPLPFAKIDNKRSFIHRDDLAEMVWRVATAARPPESLLAAHEQSISTPGLIRALADGLDVRARLFSWPAPVLRVGAALLGRSAMWQSLAGDFAANPAAARALGWRSAHTLQENLAMTARYYSTTEPSA